MFSVTYSHLDFQPWSQREDILRTSCFPVEASCVPMCITWLPIPWRCGPGFFDLRCLNALADRPMRRSERALRQRKSKKPGPHRQGIGNQVMHIGTQLASTGKQEVRKISSRCDQGWKSRCE